MLASTCQRIDQVRCIEIADYATYDGDEVMRYMGFGRPLDDMPMLLLPGVLSIAWGAAIRQLAAGLGAELDEITESLRPDWPQPAQPGGSYRVAIVGEQSYTVGVCPTSRKGDHNHAAIAGAAGRIVSAIPAAVAAPPGIRTTLGLPLVTGSGLYAGPDAVCVERST